MTWLKRLIMDGFKSYGSGRVELPLTRGFNAVIGPNGSGKSNIVDAILFVLGGLSTKTMRAASLLDLIFVGTNGERQSLKTRVEMILDNTDHKIPIRAEEVRISREVRRSGNSVYRLNGLVSTRKEIVDLLALGNIGVHGRNIVLQGEIIQLITHSPQERRELVESVAGITDFEEKKIEAERELAKAKVRYREIDLLLGGLLEARERLAREKEEAERYISLQIKIEKKTALLLAIRATLLETKLKKLQYTEDQHQKKRAAAQQKKAEFELEKDKIAGQLSALDQEYSKLQEQEITRLLSLSDEKRAEKIELESKATFEQEKITQYKDEHRKLVQNVEELMDAREQLTPQEINLTEELSDISDLLGEKTAKFMNLRKEQEELDKALENDRNQVRILTKKLEKKKKHQIECETQKTFIQSHLQSNTDLLIGIRTKRTNLQELLKDLDNNLEILTKQQAEATESLKQARTQVETIREHKIILDTQFKTALEALSQTESEKIQLETELRVLRDEKTDKALTASADAILLAVQQGELEIQDVRGPVSTMFNFPQELQKLLSTTFPTIMGALVVSDVKTAAKIIEFTKNSHIGQIAILIRELISQNTKVAPNSLMAFLECSEKDRPLGAYLFGNVCLTDNLREIRFDSNTYLTRQGEIFDTTRACVIGADTGLSRISKLQDELLPKLQETCEAQLQQKLELEQEITNLSKRLESMVEQLRIEEAQYAELVQRDRTHRMELERTRTQLLELNQQITELERQEEEYQKELSNLDTTIADLTHHLPHLEGELLKLNEIIEGKTRRELELQIDSLRDELDTLRLEETDLRLELDKIQTRKDELIEPGIQNGLLRQEELLRQIEEAKQLTTTLTQECQQTEKELANLTIQIEAAREQMTNLSEQRDDLRTAHNAIVEQIAHSQKEEDQIQLAISKLEFEKNQYENELVEVRQSAARLSKPHHFEPETLSGLEPATLRKELLQHQHEKDELGSVNLKAPEQYTEIDQRYTEILKKRDTLNKERKVILETIEELEQKKRSAFFSTFEQLNIHFNELFMHLSPGSDSYARLVLENPQNPFEGGILLEARPQGKRIKSIASMSGGEKSLAALALLFAIQKVETSPFYVFDEIDAFLDAANVNRVAELLSELSKETQILLVTLREPMMALADQLYAVSNIDGISCVFGINLQDILDGKIQIDLEQGDELVDSRV